MYGDAISRNIKNLKTYVVIRDFFFKKKKFILLLLIKFLLHQRDLKVYFFNFITHDHSQVILVWGMCILFQIFLKKQQTFIKSRFYSYGIFKEQQNYLKNKRTTELFLVLIYLFESGNYITNKPKILTNITVKILRIMKHTFQF